MTTFKDLTGQTIRERQKTSLDTRLNTILNAFGEYANMQAAKDEKMVLNVVDSLARKSGTFNSSEQFELAFQSLNEARDMTKGGVAKSLLDNYETTLLKEQNTFVADDAIKTAYTDTKKRLGSLSSENHTEEIASILEVLNAISEEYRNDASAATLKMLDSLNQDVRYAVDFANLLDDVDKTPAVGDSPNVWDDMGLGIGYSQVRELMLAGDYKQARTKANQIQLRDSDALLDEIGNYYQKSVKNLRAHANELKNVADVNLTYAANKVASYIPKTPVGTQKMYPQKLDDLLVDTGNVFRRYFANKEINWDDTDKGGNLRDAFKAEGRFADSMGGWHEFMEQLNQSIIYDTKGISNEREIDPQMYEEWLNKNVDFVPNEWLGNDPGYLLGARKGDDNILAARKFVEYMMQYNALLSGKERMTDIVNKQTLGM
jgi:hypothetical protein